MAQTPFNTDGATLFKGVSTRFGPLTIEKSIEKYSFWEHKLDIRIGMPSSCYVERHHSMIMWLDRTHLYGALIMLSSS
jgi:hypothetical protein